MSTKSTAAVLLSATASLSLALGGVVSAPAAHANAAPTTDGETATQAIRNRDAASHNVQLNRVVGTFSYDQNAVDSNETIARVIGKASAVLCGVQGAQDFKVSACDEPWAIHITGDVQKRFTLSESELEENEYEQRLMKCSCSGNPADGASAVQAHVAGVSVADVIARAKPAEAVNTIVFTSADGYEVALPYNYVVQRSSLIVYQINEECLDASVGGNNQLWLGATSARYFARNIVEISLEQRETPPPAPGTKEARESYANNPNIAVQSGGAGAEQ